jgi:hypothetical protein
MKYKDALFGISKQSNPTNKKVAILEKSFPASDKSF